MSGNGDKRVIIVGGGPAGLTAAYRLSKLGRKSIVVEKDSVVGGLSRTVNYKDFLFDIGGHRFFTKIKEVEQMWRDVLGEDFLRCERKSRIYYQKKFFYYPLRPLNTISGLGLVNSFLVIMSYLKAHLFPYKKEDTFEKWISNRFGKRLFDIFFRTYTEKVWGMPCNEIRAEWAAQRIRDLSLTTVIKKAFEFQSKNNSKDDVVRTLIDFFDYPKLGPGMMWNAVYNIINNNGTEVYLNSEVREIHWDMETCRVKSVVINRGSERHLIQGSDLISSMPIKELIKCLKPSPPDSVVTAAGNLRYRDFLTVALIINKRELFPDNWIYIHDPEVRVGRIQNFKNWSPHMVPDPEKTCLGLEYFCYEGDDLWNMPDEDLVEMGKNEIEKLGLASCRDVEDGCVVRMPKAYPSYDLKYREMLAIVRKFLKGIKNIYPVGRNGMHRYNNQDHSMLTAMLAVENIEGAEHDLWKVNDEPSYHEESSYKSQKIVGSTLSLEIPAG